MSTKSVSLPSPKERLPLRQHKSVILGVSMAIFAIYIILPLAWLVINATKDQSSLFTTFGLWFGSENNLFTNITTALSYDNGIYLKWLRNTVVYVVIGAGGATLFAALAGYALAIFEFPGRKLIFVLVLAGIAVPGTALAVPTFLMFSQLGLANTMWAVILPSLVSPFGLYLVWVYAAESVPMSIVEAARIDGASELRIFFTIALKMMTPGVITVLLFSIVATWNNYFLPLIMLSDPELYPLTVGLNQWNAQSSTVGGDPIYNLVITGSLLAIIPIVIIFLFLQRFWQSGLAAGGVKE